MTTDTHDPNASTLAMIAGAGLCPARISSISGGYSANLWRVDGHDGHPVAVLKRAASSSARVTAERAALDHITRHAPEALRAHTPRVLAANTSHHTRALLLSWVGDHTAQQTCTLEDALSQHTATPEALERFGETLAKLHAIEIPEGSSLKLSDDPLSLPSRLRAMQQRALEQLEKRHTREPINDFERIFASARAADRELARRLDPEAHHIEDYPGRLIHRDLRAANIMLAQNGTRFAGIIDFERAAASDPAWDFVKLDAWIFSRWPEASAPILAGYTRILPLPPDERIETFALHEALTTLGFFAGRHDDYTKEALARIAPPAGLTPPAGLAIARPRPP
jgi:aminoglycoside phosphotransferase (APT) family kinase protein